METYCCGKTRDLLQCWSHHSLVTPIEWKRRCGGGGERIDHHPGHHSLVTPIEWKRGHELRHVPQLEGGHHSLVTPIEWKHFCVAPPAPFDALSVTTRW